MSLRTKENLKAEFKSIEGITDNDRLVKLLELYRKFQLTQNNFSIDDNLDVIEKAFDTIKVQLNAISSSVNQYERTLNETYVIDIANEMKLLKEQIQNEDILNSKILSLKMDLDILNEKHKKKDILLIELQNRLKEIEISNSDYLALNNQLVSKENDYINQLREKDIIINLKDTDINKLINEYESKLVYLKEKNELSIKDYESKVNRLDKENAVLKANIKSIENENKELKNRVDFINKESKDKIKDYKNKIENLENQLIKSKEDTYMLTLDKIKLESKIENLENKINAKSSNNSKAKLKSNIPKNKETKE